MTLRFVGVGGVSRTASAVGPCSRGGTQAALASRVSGSCFASGGGGRGGGRASPATPALTGTSAAFTSTTATSRAARFSVRGTGSLALRGASCALGIATGLTSPGGSRLFSSRPEERQVAVHAQESAEEVGRACVAWRAVHWAELVVDQRPVARVLGEEDEILAQHSKNIGQKWSLQLLHVYVVRPVRHTQLLLARAVVAPLGRPLPVLLQSKTGPHLSLLPPELEERSLLAHPLNAPAELVQFLLLLLIGTIALPRLALKEQPAGHVAVAHVLLVAVLVRWLVAELRL